MRDPHIYDARMGGYNVLDTPGGICANVGKSASGWAVLDHRGELWIERYATRREAADAAVDFARKDLGR